MKRTALRAVLTTLDQRVFDLDLLLTGTEYPEFIALELQRVLDEAQQRLDDARKDG